MERWKMMYNSILYNETRKINFRQRLALRMYAAQYQRCGQHWPGV